MCGRSFSTCSLTQHGSGRVVNQGKLSAMLPILKKSEFASRLRNRLTRVISFCKAKRSLVSRFVWPRSGLRGCRDVPGRPPRKLEGQALPGRDIVLISSEQLIWRCRGQVGSEKRRAASTSTQSQKASGRLGN
jgi:hypothetical protein